jgi:single-strand DNA-binding protein
MSINTITLEGRAGADAEMRYFDSGNSVTSFNMAFDEFYKGEKKTNWIKVVIFGGEKTAKFAEYAVQHIKKGSLVWVHGELKQEEWTDKDDVVQKRFYILCRQLGLAVREIDRAYKVPAQTEDDIPF